MSLKKRSSHHRVRSIVWNRVAYVVLEAYVQISQVQYISQVKKFKTIKFSLLLYLIFLFLVSFKLKIDFYVQPKTKLPIPFAYLKYYIMLTSFSLQKCIHMLCIITIVVSYKQINFCHKSFFSSINLKLTRRSITKNKNINH